MNIEHTLTRGLNSVLEEQYPLFHESSKRSLVVSCNLLQRHGSHNATEFLEDFAWEEGSSVRIVRGAHRWGRRVGNLQFLGGGFCCRWSWAVRDRETVSIGPLVIWVLVKSNYFLLRQLSPTQSADVPQELYSPPLQWRSADFQHVS
jgi:hypothetical protein